METVMFLQTRAAEAGFEDVKQFIAEPDNLGKVVLDMLELGYTASPEQAEANIMRELNNHEIMYLTDSYEA